MKRLIASIALAGLVATPAFATASRKATPAAKTMKVKGAASVKAATPKKK